MTWQIDLSRQAEKFLVQNQISQEEIFLLVKKAIRKFQGENINIDIKKLKGVWLGFFRIRTGKLRIIVEFNFDISIAFIEKIDWRGGVYL